MNHRPLSDLETYEDRSPPSIAEVSAVTCYFRHLQHIFKKYPGGVEAQKKLLEREGHEVIQKGKQHVVVEYEKRLQKL